MITRPLRISPAPPTRVFSMPFRTSDSLVLLARRDQSELGGPAAEHDVLGHRHVGHQMMFLMDRGDAGLVGGRRRGRQRLTIDQDFTFVVFIESGHQLDERRFAGAVFAEQRIDLARPHIEIDVVERLDARKRLAHPANREDRGHIRCGLGRAHVPASRLT